MLQVFFFYILCIFCNIQKEKIIYDIHIVSLSFMVKIYSVFLYLHVLLFVLFVEICLSKDCYQGDV